MKLLALETSTRHGGAAIIVDERVVAEATSDRQRSHSELLHVFATEVLNQASLKLSDLDAFAVGQGPGSFTGIRVAGNAAKTFAASLNKPLVAVDTLTQVASRVLEKSRPVLVLLNAYKNMVYYGLFDVSEKEPRFLKGPGVAGLAEVGGLFSGEVTVVGDGFELCRAVVDADTLGRMRREPNPIDGTSPGTLGILAHRRLEKGLVLDWKSFVPLYLRASEAEESSRSTLFAKGPVHGKNQ